MTTAATHHEQSNITEATLFVAFELSEKTSKLGFTTEHGQQPRERTVPARQQERVRDAIAQAKRHMGLPENAAVVRCYEAGRAGFWLHRFLQAHGLTSQAVSGATISSRTFSIIGSFFRCTAAPRLVLVHAQPEVAELQRQFLTAAPDSLRIEPGDLRQQLLAAMTKTVGLKGGLPDVVVRPGATATHSSGDATPARNAVCRPGHWGIDINGWWPRTWHPLSKENQIKPCHCIPSH